MTLLKIAFRNIFRQKRRAVLTALTMFGGFALAAISIGWSDGTYSFIIDKFTRNRLGHIQIHAQGYRDRPTLYKNIDNYKAIGKKLDNIKKIESWSPRLFASGLVSVAEPVSLTTPAVTSTITFEASTLLSHRMELTILVLICSSVRIMIFLLFIDFFFIWGELC
ncbi:MAG: hypothetical protein U9N83_09195 [Thermodesulfobacteriota bacterium]|nr:hypothetical protein [Thermodesulfobacteriota bacterium]